MRRLLLSFLILALVPSLFFAQETFKVSGKVTDAKTGEALIGANVMLKTLNLGAATDLEGNYTFDVPKSLANGQGADLTASFVNYKKKTVRVTLNGTNITHNFALDEDVFQNEEIVVTGIASKTAKAVAEVSVGRVDAANLSTINTYNSLSQLVGGKVAGVQLNTSSGNVGSGWRFFVRGGGGLNGNEQPTIYLDGTRLDNTEINYFGNGGQGTSLLSNLNTDDIDKIEFLKGPAAAAMYGTNGSNGVVLITTKAGKLAQGLGQGLSIDYKFNYGYNQKMYSYKTGDFISANDANNIFVTGYLRSHAINVAGGGTRLRYYTSIENRSELGIIPGNSENRTSVRLNVSSFPSDNLTLKLSSNYVYNKLLRPWGDNNVFGWLGNTLLRPTSYTFTSDAAMRVLDDQSIVNEFIGNVSAIWTPIENLEVVAGIGVDNSGWEEKRLFPYGYSYGGGLITTGEKDIYNRNNRQFTYDFNANYSFKLFDMINVRSLIGSQIFTQTLRFSAQQGQQFSSNLISSIGAAGKIIFYDEGITDLKQAGIFTEHSFSYLDQYFLTLGLRKDYASVIGEEAPSITYPKASFAVRLDKYDFLPLWVGLLKVRAAYGESGVLPGTTDAIPLLWTAQTGGYGAGAVLSIIGNSAIQPERVKELELGFDTELFTDISLEFTYYKGNAVNSIIGLLNAPSTGKTASSQPFNIGAIKSHGWETLIQYSPIRSIDYNLDLSLTWNYQTNMVESLGGAQPIYDGFGFNVIQEGMKKHEFFGFVSTGAILSTTTGKYSAPQPTVDANGVATKIDLGSPTPDHSGSFSVNFKFLKNFNLYALAQWALNFKVVNYTKFFATRFGNNPYVNRLRALLGLSALAPGVAPTDVTPITPGTPEYKQTADEYSHYDVTYGLNYVEDGDYLIVRELSLGYDFTDLLKDFDIHTYVKALTAGFSVRNLVRFTKYTGADPEINTAGSRSLSYGQDFLTLQSPRTLNFWVRIGL
ncbi:MAG: TonB-dependent receptor [Ignavibacteriales bacterium]|nr:TonB-dependent receptor [Ignavibacteriales bacterium]